MYKTAVRHRLVHQRALPCTKRQHGIAWYTRGRSLYKTAVRHRLVHQRAFPCTKQPCGIAWYTRGRFHVQNSTASLGTPEGVPMYKTAVRHRLVHQRAFSCTKRQHGIAWYTQRAFSCTKRPHGIAWYTRGRFPVQNGRTASLGTPRVWQKYKKNVKLYNRPLPYRQEPPLNPEILVTCKISVERGFLSI